MGKGWLWINTDRSGILELLQLLELLELLPYACPLRAMDEQQAATITPRSEDRAPDQARSFKIVPNIAPNAHGSVLVSTGNTQVICAVCFEETVPRWMKEQNVTGGWITAEYSMLPYSTLTRRPRDISKGKLDGRGVEIQRLIGRSLRAAIDLDLLGQRTLWIDCDVLQADGGTRTAAISGATVATALAFAKLIAAGTLEKWPLRSLVAAVSVGMVDGKVFVDLDYEEDRRAAVDLNLVMSHRGEFIEIQGTGEEATFSGDDLSGMLAAGQRAIAAIIGHQRRILRDLAPEIPRID
ncbi:MAG TPA: ribonuclease PH [Chthoniobacterales bacterium]|nr:ribonuclease PH [Chthoniobacterales bacterium]